YVGGSKTAYTGFDDVTEARRHRVDGLNTDSIAHRQFKSARVVFKVGDNLFARKKSIGSCTWDFSSWQNRLPVRGVQGERIPATIAPHVAWYLCLLQNDVRALLLGQVIADCKSCLPTANHHRFYMLVHVASFKMATTI